MQILNHWTRSYVFSVYLVKFQEIYMDFISDRILQINCQWTGDFFKYWAVCTISASQENSRSLCSQVSVYFQGFYCGRVLASRLMNSAYFWLILPRKGSKISAWQENNLCLCSRSSAIFHGFYLVQKFCICIESSKFLVYFNNWIGCRISASWLNWVNYWPIGYWKGCRISAC